MIFWAGLHASVPKDIWILRSKMPNSMPYFSLNV